MIKPYVSYFASYLIDNLKNLDFLNRIILFGSVARGEARKDSDVDVFVELKKESQTVKKEIEKVLESFYKSREALLFKSRGVDNKINLIIGKLDEWKELKESISLTGIVLYGPYTDTKKSGRKFQLIFWDSISKNRGAFLNKLYGFRAGGKVYLGIIEKYGGKRTGKSSLIIPAEYAKEVFNLISQHKANAKTITVYADKI